eukprot:CAMPEP_0183351134 /NCGR_PEP_ID=MMETSP0164_2-20130417/23373_1 /TAXON_ID=221442 /ORGANISM="Coccolithus pelagicus ssp braarudi, Strain PLY182g" /LENGTH=75 /DNA_ID=CAMNT_0025523245 /DNA_START=13 /DNA_END=240 /DNA_ORIENTATION=-
MEQLAPSPSTGSQYAKDVKSTILMKNPSLRMAYRPPDETVPKQPQPKIFLGNKKSDVTNGFEKIYARSYPTTQSS